ncbi:MAG: DUF488 domain-containing protein [bacterium]
MSARISTKYHIYTIGYSAFHDINHFISILKANKISCLIDVRSSPFSSFFPHYNKDNLIYSLKNHSILYRNYLNEFGARQENPIYHHQGGYLDFTKFIQSNQFLSGVDKVQKGIDLGYTFCLMCAEADPINCHRSVMLSRGFKNNDFQISHILRGGETISHQILEKNLVSLYFSHHNQLTIFDGLFENSSTSISEDALLISAYSQQNKLIGFRKQNP